MTRLLLALGLLFALSFPAQAQRACDQATPFQHATATARTALIPGVAGQRIYYCGFMIAQKGQALDLQITYGTGVNCGTNTHGSLVYSLPNDFALVNRIENVGPHTDLGESLCVQTFGTGALTGVIYWAQF